MDGCSHITSTFACPVSDEQQVDGAPAEDLIGDVPVLALGVPSFGSGRGPQRRRMPACVTDGRVGTSSALGFRPNHHSPSGATFFPLHQPRLVESGTAARPYTEWSIVQRGGSDSLAC